MQEISTADTNLDEALQQEIDEANRLHYLSQQEPEDKEPQSDSNPKQSTSSQLTKKSITNMRDLSFVRLIDPIHIPSYLVEQIKDRLYDTEKFYSYQKITCLFHTSNGPQLNPTNLLYAIVHDRLRQVKGFLWMVLDILTNSLIIQNFSMDKEYWNRGESISLLEEKAKKVMQDLKLSRIVWITKSPKFCENRGFKRSKDVIMIYED